MICCKHIYEEKYGDLREEFPGGPHIYHEIYWECANCGKLLTKGCDPKFVKTLIESKKHA